MRITRQHSLPFLTEIHTAEEYALFLSNRVFAEDTVLVASAEGHGIAGFIAYREGWVDHLYVLPEFQRLGAGKRLLDRAKQEWPVLELWTFQRNTSARRFYEREGFSIVKFTDGAANEEREPDVLLRWETRGREVCWFKPIE